MSEKMTILEVLKKVKHIDRKIEKNKDRVARWCSYFNVEVGQLNQKPLPDPPYNTEKLIQALNDLIKLRAELQHALHEANITNTVEYKGKKMSIDELIVLKTKTLPMMLGCLRLLRRKEKTYQNTSHMPEEERKQVYVVNQFNPTTRDKNIDEIEDEIAKIDTILDEINITLPTTIDR
jgi:hypothetical protein